MADEQDEVLRFLEGGALGGPVERIATHGAIVLLAGERAFKLKRPVQFSFMDFSTLERRERTLRTEFELNRRTAPMLYRRVLPVTREPGGELALDGRGAPVEWLLEMRRFPAEAQLDRVAERGGLDPPLAEALAQEIAGFHAVAAVRRDQGGHRAMRAVVLGNARDLEELVPDILAQDAVAALNRATLAELERLAGLLDARRAAGWVRHCHGDLHLGNIVLLDGVPVLFDALEFDEALACTDTLYDLAFLVMDLDERGLRPQAWTVLQAYVERTGVEPGLALLPLFLSVRAAVRAKVAGLRARTLAAAARSEGIATAHAYLAYAAAALAPPPPRLLAVGGRSGTGKSSVARALAPGLGAAPGAVLLRSDVVRKTLAGVAPTTRLPSEAYTAARSAEVFAAIARHAKVLLAAGRTVIADGVFGAAAQRQEIAAAARAAGVPFRAVWLEAPEGELERRVAARRNDASDADLAVVRSQAGHLARARTGWPGIAAGRPLAEVAAEVRRVWES